MFVRRSAIPGGQPQPLLGRLSAVDNSRETVDDKGILHGIRATASTSKVISGLAISAARPSGRERAPLSEPKPQLSESGAMPPTVHRR
jgi:hypothetical protein